MTMEAPYLHISAQIAIIPRTTEASSDGCTTMSGVLAENDQALCDRCQALDFIDIDLKEWLPATNIGVNDARLTLVISRRDDGSPSCSMCSILAHIKNNYYHLRRAAVWNAFDTAFKAYFSNLDASTQNLLDKECTVFGCLSPNSGLCMAQSTPESIDFSCARSWIQHCTANHACCRGRDSVIEGLRLIDCQTRRIVEAPADPRWIALSYVWGPEVTMERSHDLPERSQKALEYPPTVKDAITVTLALHERYLWVDAYCIDQKHAVHKADQISKMDRIYQGAVLTVVATGPDKFHGLPGVSSSREPRHSMFNVKDKPILYTGPDPIEAVERSAWSSRGW